MTQYNTQTVFLRLHDVNYAFYFPTDPKVSKSRRNQFEHGTDISHLPDRVNQNAMKAKISETFQSYLFREVRQLDDEQHVATRTPKFVTSHDHAPH